MDVKVTFVRDETIDCVEVVVKAKERTKEVERLLQTLRTDDTLVCEPLSSEENIDPDDVVILSKSGRYLSVKTTRRSKRF